MHSGIRNNSLPLMRCVPHAPSDANSVSERPPWDDSTPDSTCPTALPRCNLDGKFHFNRACFDKAAALMRPWDCDVPSTSVSRNHTMVNPIPSSCRPCPTPPFRTVLISTIRCCANPARTRAHAGKVSLAAHSPRVGSAPVQLLLRTRMRHTVRSTFRHRHQRPCRLCPHAPRPCWHDPEENLRRPRQRRLHPQCRLTFGHHWPRSRRALR